MFLLDYLLDKEELVYFGLKQLNVLVVLFMLGHHRRKLLLQKLIDSHRQAFSQSTRKTLHISHQYRLENQGA
jgi:hypothetical protein